MGGRGGGARGARSVTVGKGASGGKRYGSKPMQQFHEMRSQMDKRKCESHGVQGFMLLLAWLLGLLGLWDGERLSCRTKKSLFYAQLLFHFILFSIFLL